MLQRKLAVYCMMPGNCAIANIIRQIYYSINIIRESMLEIICLMPKTCLPSAFSTAPGDTADIK